jgi:hypothetical protein
MPGTLKPVVVNEYILPSKEEKEIAKNPLISASSTGWWASCRAQSYNQGFVCHCVTDFAAEDSHG